MSTRILQILTLSTSILSAPLLFAHTSLQEQQSFKTISYSPQSCNHNTKKPCSKKKNTSLKRSSPYLPYAMNYILPYNYTFSPAPNDVILNGQQNKKEEVKFQFSVQAILWRNMFHQPINLSFFYTQLSYWQFYAKSAYFRETDYNPGAFLHIHASQYKQLPFKLHAIDVGLMHQSNGRGDLYERSWNRAFLDFQFLLNKHWAISVRPWVRLNGFLEAHDYNPRIQHFLGYGDIRFSYQHDNIRLSLMLRNTLASRFARGAEELDCAFPLYKHLHGFVQVFSGYGQSLIAYDHYTNAVGIGVSLYNRYTPQFH